MRFLFVFILATMSLSAQAPDAFTEACVSGKVKEVEAAVAALPPEKWTEGTKDCLETAALNGHVELARLLLKLGTPVGGFDGWTPLHVAAIYSYPDCIVVAELLIKAGANVNAVTLVERNGIKAGLTPTGVAHASRVKFQATFGVRNYENMIEFLKNRGGK